MHNSQFCHLHNHSHFSTLDGYGSPEKYAERAAEMGFKHLGLTDHGSVSGLIEHQTACEKYDIHPVLGMEGYIVPNMHEKDRKNAHINFFVKNEKGWATLMNMMTVANNTGFYYKPRMDFNLLLNSDLEGLIITTACAGSFLNLDGGIDFFWKLRDKIGDNLLIEIMPHNIDSQEKIHKKIERMIDRDPLLLPQLIATNDCHYVKEEDTLAQEVLLAVNRNVKWNNPHRFSFGFDGLYLRSASEMLYNLKTLNHFSTDIIKNSIYNTVSVAERCTFTIPKRKISLPAIPSLNPRESETDKVWEIATDGYQKIFKKEMDKEYYDRLLFEFNLLRKKGFLRYFLLVWDLIKYCKSEGIPVGPGRGSVGGSLLAYLMGITKIDPLKYGLFFERFIAEDRADYPDIDIDFSDIMRFRVEDYLKKTYGENHICSIPTFITIKDRGAIRDVCRVFDVPDKEVDVFAKSIWRNDTIESATRNTREGKIFYQKYKKEVDLAIKLDKTIKAMGRHPAALVVSGEDLTKTDKTCLRTISGHPTACWSMNDAEYCGLMKLDSLSLNTLTVIGEAQRLIRKEEMFFDIDKIPMDDKDVFDILSDGYTAGVFQMSSETYGDYITKLRIDDFNDIVASAALVRPGPMDSGMADDYIERKHGSEWKESHPIYEEITKDTYGVCVYQEQMMQIISKMAGLPFSTADKIRKVIGKKRDAEEFKPFEIQFIKGCKKEKTFSEKEAKRFWEGLLKWAQYGFNKAHSVAYGLIAYQTAWLKYHYSTEFILAHLTYGKEKFGLVREAKQLGYKFMPPKIGISKAAKWVFSNDKIYAPFVFINGFGEKKAELIAKPIRSHNFGFFPQEAPHAKGEAEIILRKIGAYSPDEIPWEANDYVELKIF